MDRLLTPARRAQGFTSQAHLDVWFAYYDHTRACAGCGRPGPAAETSDGPQPTVIICPDGIARSAAAARFTNPR
jgi:hypothetical protein